MHQQLDRKRILAHVGAVFVVCVWGTTFIATKLLLEHAGPVDIMLARFLIGYVSLCVLCPRALPFEGPTRELWYLLAGGSGMTVYYFLENTALTYTLAANVGIIIAAVPFFTGLLSFAVYRDRKALSIPFFLGFVIAIIGIAMISLNGARLQMNPFGDLLTVAAALCWALYSLILKKIQGFGKPSMAVTRRIFYWGTLSGVMQVCRSA